MEAIEAQAREQLGLILPGETYFQIVNPPSQGDVPPQLKACAWLTPQTGPGKASPLPRRDFDRWRTDHFRADHPHLSRHLPG